MRQRDKQRMEDGEAPPEASEHDEESPDVEGHKLHIGEAARLADPDKAFH